MASFNVSSSNDTCTSGGTGFGLMAVMIGCQRGFLTRDQAAARILKTVEFLEEKAQRYHGAWSHWINGKTGKTIPFSKYDNAGDLVETSFLVQGMLTVRQYFNADLSDLADRGAQYTRRVVHLAVRLVVEDGLPYRSASWHLWRDHRVFVPWATLQNWVEATGEKS